MYREKGIHPEIRNPNGCPADGTVHDGSAPIHDCCLLPLPARCWRCHGEELPIPGSPPGASSHHTQPTLHLWYVYTSFGFTDLLCTLYSVRYDVVQRKLFTEACFSLLTSILLIYMCCCLINSCLFVLKDGTVVFPYFQQQQQQQQDSIPVARNLRSRMMV